MCQAVQQTFPHLLGVLFHPETALRIEASISLSRLVVMKKQDQEGLVTGLRLHSDAGIGGTGLWLESLFSSCFASCPWEAAAGDLAGGWAAKEGRKSTGEDSSLLDQTSHSTLNVHGRTDAEAEAPILRPPDAKS